MEELKNRSFRFRPRRELEIIAPLDASAQTWTIFDPFSRTSYRVGELESWLLGLGGAAYRSLSEVLVLRGKAFPRENLSHERFEQTVLQLGRMGLLQYAGQTTNAIDMPRTSWLSKLVFFQVRGIQPERLLTRIAPLTSFLFSRLAVALWLGFVAITAIVVVLNFQRIGHSQALTSIWQRPALGGSLFLIFIVTRALHELGHAIACTRQGVRCPDIGFYFILGAPCVYCDVSESWKLRKNWRRAAVAAAGIYVELIVAAIAAWVWILTLESTLNTLAFQTMLVCSISTLLINSNPLMKFDGYYMLADWLDEANLRAKADQLVVHTFKRLVLNQHHPTTLSRKRTAFLLAFSIAGFGYRVLLSLAIAAAVASMFARWHVAAIGQCLAFALLISWWGKPLRGFLMAQLSAPGLLAKMRYATLACASLAVALMVPLPNRSSTSGWIEPVHVQGIYTPHTGQLVRSLVSHNQAVRLDQPLFELANKELEVEKSRLGFALSRARISQRHISYRNQNLSSNIEIGGWSDVENATELYNNVCQQLENLTLRSPSQGKFVAMPAPSLVGPDLHRDEVPLDTWCNARQQGRTVAQGTLLGVVLGEEMQALLPLQKDQLSSVTAGSEVRLCIPQLDHRVLYARVTSIQEYATLTSPWSSTATIGETPASKFVAVVALSGQNEEALRLIAGTQCDAVFVLEATNLVTHFSRWAKANLRSMTR